MSTPRALPRCGAVLTLFLSLLSACVGNPTRAYRFEADTARLGHGAEVTAAMEGTWVSYDSAGRRLSRSASPYRVYVYVEGVDKVPAVMGVTLRGLRSGRVTKVKIPEVGLLTGERGAYVGWAEGVRLPFEDHEMLLRVRARRGGRIREDTVRLRVRTKLVVDAWSPIV